MAQVATYCDVTSVSVRVPALHLSSGDSMRSAKGHCLSALLTLVLAAAGSPYQSGVMYTMSAAHGLLFAVATVRQTSGVLGLSWFCHRRCTLVAHAAALELASKGGGHDQNPLMSDCAFQCYLGFSVRSTSGTPPKCPGRETLCAPTLSSIRELQYCSQRHPAQVTFSIVLFMRSAHIQEGFPAV